MKKANATLATCFGFFLLCALSMGNRMYLLISAIIALAWVFSLASVRMAEKSVKVENALSGAKVNRGEVVSMEISVSHRSLLPIAPVALHMRATSNTPAGTIHLTQLGRRRQVCGRSCGRNVSRGGKLRGERRIRLFQARA